MKKQTNAEEANNRNDFVTEADAGVEISTNHRDLSVGYDFGAKEKYQSHTRMFKAGYSL